MFTNDHQIVCTTRNIVSMKRRIKNICTHIDHLQNITGFTVISKVTTKINSSEGQTYGEIDQSFPTLVTLVFLSTVHITTPLSDTY